MMIITKTEVKQIDYSYKIINELGININLNDVLIKECEQGLPIDISCPL